MKIQSRYGLSLGLLLIAILIQAFPYRPVQILVDVIFVAVLAVILLDPRSPRWARILGVIAIAVSTTSSIVYGATQNHALGTFSYSLNVIVLALTAILVLRRLTQHDIITMSTVMGAILAYALFAIICASAYNAVELATNQPFFAQPDIQPGDYVYFSFVTVTTLGFGDLTPATELAKRLVILEAFIGQVFLVVMVARLVSLWGTSRRASVE